MIERATDDRDGPSAESEPVDLDDSRAGGPPSVASRRVQSSASTAPPRVRTTTCLGFGVARRIASATASGRGATTASIEIARNQ